MDLFLEATIVPLRRQYETERLSRAVESLDRLSRDEVLDAPQIFTSILKQAITILTLAGNVAYTPKRSQE
jgi:hypothetical protein